MLTYFLFCSLVLLAGSPILQTVIAQNKSTTVAPKTNADTATTGAATQKEKKKEPAEVQWMSFKEAVVQTQKQPKKILIDIYTSWCGWCKKMERRTYAQPHIAQYINKNYYPVKFNAERKDTIILGKDTLTSRKGTHELALKLMKGKASYPTTVFLNEKMQMIQPIPGFIGPKKMDLILKYFGEDHHKKRKFKQFKKNYMEIL